MSQNAMRFAIASLASGCVLALAVSEAHSQGLLANPYARPVPTYAAGHWGYTADPYGSFLHGAADAIRASSDRLVKVEQAQGAQIDNRRKLVEQWLWEREHLPTAEDNRQLLHKQLTEHSRNNPTITEIWSGGVLNYLLVDIHKRPNYYATANPVDPSWLPKLNLTTGKKGANFGLLKSGKVPWPLLLRRPSFAAERQRLDQLVDRALKQAAQDQMDVEAIDDIDQRLKELHKKLNQQLRAAPEDDTWTPSIYIDARGFLTQFFDAVKVLREPNAGQYVTGKFAAQGKTVGELVQFMMDKGLRFAPATPGTENAYSALHKAMMGPQ